MNSLLLLGVLTGAEEDGTQDKPRILNIEPMISAECIGRYVDATLAEKMKRAPPEVGDLVHILEDPRVETYDLLGKDNKDPMTLQAVPLGIVTGIRNGFHVDEFSVEEGAERQDISGDFLAVRLLTDGGAGAIDSYVQAARCIPIQFLPKVSNDAIPSWKTDENNGTRRMTFGTPFADSDKLAIYGEGNLYLTAKSSPIKSTLPKGLPEDHFAREVWSFEAGMLFRLDDDNLLKKQTSKRGLAFAKEANNVDGTGNLMLLGLRTFKFDPLAEQVCGYLATNPDHGHVVMAYVTTSRDVVEYAKCVKNGTDLEGPTGPMVYECTRSPSENCLFRRCMISWVGRRKMIFSQRRFCIPS